MSQNYKDLYKRIERLEAIEEIKQLAGKYSLSLDMRDLDAHVGLFLPDVKVGKDKRGRTHLKQWVDDTLRHQFTGTSHHLGQHIIEFTSETEAVGVVYSKNEHETGNEWIIMQMLYWDDYVKENGRWYFKRRLPCYWYASDINKAPVGDMKMRWPGREPYRGTFHELFPTWLEFWSSNKTETDVAEPAPINMFLNTMRRGTPNPKIRVK